MKNCDLGIENTQSLGHSFLLYGPPNREITYMYPHLSIAAFCLTKWHTDRLTRRIIRLQKHK